MNRMICSLIAAGAAALAVASPAHAQPLPRAEKYGRAEYRWERARFEHWYARRCEELRYRGW